MPKVILLNDPDTDTFGVYVDKMLVYNYDWLSLDDALQSVATALGIDFIYKEVEAEWDDELSRYVIADSELEKL